MSDFIATDLERFLERRFGDVESSGDGRELKINCPFCAGNKKLWINQDKRMVHCFKCEYGSSIKSFLAKMGEKFEEIVKSDPILARGEWDKAFEDKINKVFDGMFLKRTDNSGVVNLPENFVPLYERLDKDDISGARAYLRARGFYDSAIRKYKIGYCLRGIYAWRIILPVYMDGNLVYYTGRFFLPREVSRKYLNPNIKKNAVIFNYDSITEGGRVVVCEGIFDAMKGGDGYIAILGKSMSVEQKRLLYRKKPSEVVVFLDPDAVDFGIKLAKELGSFFPTKVVTKHKCDAGSMTTEEVHAHVAAASSVDVSSLVDSIIRRPRV